METTTIRERTVVSQSREFIILQVPCPTCPWVMQADLGAAAPHFVVDKEVIEEPTDCKQQARREAEDIEPKRKEQDEEEEQHEKEAQTEVSNAEKKDLLELTKETSDEHRLANLE